MNRLFGSHSPQNGLFIQRRRRNRRPTGRLRRQRNKPWPNMDCIWESLFKLLMIYWITLSPKTEMGKNMGDDLAEGRATLPLIYTLQHCPADTAAQIRTGVRQRAI